MAKIYCMEGLLNLFNVFNISKIEVVILNVLSICLSTLGGGGVFFSHFMLFPTFLEK